MFEYFKLCADLDKTQIDQLMKDEKILKYKQRLSPYNKEVRNWLIEVYIKHGKQLITPLRKCVLAEPLFMLFSTEKTRRKFTHSALDYLKKRHPYIEQYTDQLLLFAEDEHRRLNNLNGKYSRDYSSDLPLKLKQWVIDIKKNEQVDLLKWAETYFLYLSNEKHEWPISQLFQEGNKVHYDIRVTENRFNLDELYPKLEALDYLKGNRKLLETVMMFVWINTWDSKFKDYYFDLFKNDS